MVPLLDTAERRRSQEGTGVVDEAEREPASRSLTKH